MNKIQYSIIYAVLRQEIGERISVGIITIDDSGITVKYSDDKLKALKYFLPKSKYDFINKAIRNLPDSNTITSRGDIDYLSRYSNNLITVSPLQTIDLEPNDSNKNWLFKTYIESMVKVG